MSCPMRKGCDGAWNGKNGEKELLKQQTTNGVVSQPSEWRLTPTPTARVKT